MVVVSYGCSGTILLMPAPSFKDLIMWQKARLLTLAIYKSFAGCRDYGFRDQIQRAAVSTMNNIAEGYGRKSDKAFKNFLCIAKGSAVEVESMLSIASELRYVTAADQAALSQQTVELIKVITAYNNKIPSN